MGSTDTKSASSSLTIQAAVVALIGMALRLIGVEVAAEDVRAVVSAGGEIVTAVSIMVAIYGRFRATQKIA